jgi:hypothetical protein
MVPVFCGMSGWKRASIRDMGRAFQFCSVLRLRRSRRKG